ncbi:hypothetical protein AB0G15_38790 [Streptosporangium sp. NPDC023825]|uniref:hypothetical protein n=1 Tax=Streptosporangium sp. NPDC023825 TaxID=3154909 RepID=UPI003420E6AC
MEAEKVIRRVGIVGQGRFLALGTPAELERDSTPDARGTVVPPGHPPQLPAGITPWKRSDDFWSLLIDHDDAPELLAKLDFSTITDIRLYSATLEDLYIHYVS